MSLSFSLVLLHVAGFPALWTTVAEVEVGTFMQEHIQGLPSKWLRSSHPSGVVRTSTQASPNEDRVHLCRCMLKGYRNTPPFRFLFALNKLLYPLI